MRKGHQPPLLNLGLVSPHLRARAPLGPEEEPAEEGETQRAGAARILPAPRAPDDPSHSVRSRSKSRERWPSTPHLRLWGSPQAPSPGIYPGVPSEGLVLSPTRRIHRLPSPLGALGPSTGLGERWDPSAQSPRSN